MESIREIYRIGHGPSSSHTMAPRRAAEIFLEKNKDAVSYKVTLFGSLAATGKGHLTDIVISKVFEGRSIQIDWQPQEFLPRHNNALRFYAFDAAGKEVSQWTAYSIGGGALVDDTSTSETKKIYPHSSMEEILRWCDNNGQHFWQYVEMHEESGLWEYLAEVWKVMQETIARGLEEEGTLPGMLKLPRKAASYYVRAKNLGHSLERRSLIYAYALAVSEENASGGRVVTAPTCGASGVLPAVLRFAKEGTDASDKKILRALATAGLIGNLVKTNASISGAEVGCQGEVGTACSMASAAATQLYGGTIFQIEYSAEMGLEHHLGLTCDPVAGLVQIPCIERNAFAAARAMNHNTFVLMSDGRHRVSFDQVVKTMKQTGHDLPRLYKETSMGGLASMFEE
jgi:L-serine dehydratase